MWTVNVVNVDLSHDHVEGITRSIQTCRIVERIVNWKVECKVAIFFQFVVCLIGDKIVGMVEICSSQVVRIGVSCRITHLHFRFHKSGSLTR